MQILITLASMEPNSLRFYFQLQSTFHRQRIKAPSPLCIIRGMKSQSLGCLGLGSHKRPMLKKRLGKAPVYRVRNIAMIECPLLGLLLGLASQVTTKLCIIATPSDGHSSREALLSCKG